MAADEERAQRIRETYEQRKAANPRAYTWKRLADHVGISERAVLDWAKTGGVEYENAEKAAEFWEVDFDWLWRGDQTERETPDPFAGQPVDLEQRLEAIEQALAARLDHERKIDAMLQEQTAILTEIRRVMSGLPDDEALRLFNEGARQIAAAAEAYEAAPGASSAGQAGTRRRAG